MALPSLLRSVAVACVISCLAVAVITPEDLHTAYNAASYCVDPSVDEAHPTVRYEFQTAAECANGKRVADGVQHCAGCQWKTQSFVQSHSRLQSVTRTIASSLEPHQMGLWLVKIKDGQEVSTGLRTEWERSIGGHRLNSYVRSSTGAQFFTVLAPRSALETMQELSSVDDVIAVPSDMKIAPQLVEIIEAAKRGTLTESVGVHIGLSSTFTWEQARVLEEKWRAVLTELIPDSGMKFEVSSYDRISITKIPASAIGTLVYFVAGEPECHTIENIIKYSTNNHYASWITQSHVNLENTVWDQGLHGEGMVVGVGDSGLDHMSNFFYDAANPVSVAIGGTYVSDTHRKISQYVAYADNIAGEVGDHGTHVCGSVAGDNANTPASNFNGMAYKAKLAFFDIGVAGEPYLNVPNSLYTGLFPPAYQRGARLHSNSWGSNSNSYSSTARDVDQYMWENQDFLVLIAAGNSGTNGAGSIGTPATSKNGVCVGATENSLSSTGGGSCPDTSDTAPCEEHMAYFSSLGPMFDNRYAPTTSAPGYFITSVYSRTNPTTPHDDTGSMAGTSMATPVTTGNSALIQQYFREGWYPSGTKSPTEAFIPMGALIKAFLMNSATYMKGTHGSNQLTAEPSNAQGFGRIQLDKAMVFAASTHSLFVVGDFENMKQLNTGNSHTYSFTVTDDSRSLKVTMAYSDPPASTNAAVSLINDLDVRVTTPSATTLYPNALTAADTRNNIEQIEVKTPALGTYTVTVTGRAVPQGPQPYSLVVTGYFLKTATLFPTKVPAITAAANVLATSATSLTVSGTGFSAVLGLNTIDLTCTGGTATAAVTAASIVQLIATVDLSDCGSGALMGTVTTSGFTSLSTQMALVSDSSSSDPCDGVTCTALTECQDDGTCSVSGGVASCSYPNMPDGTECDDLDANTDNDECVAGVCKGQVACDGLAACVASDQCHEVGVCTEGYCTDPAKAKGSACNDGISSTINDACDSSGICTGKYVSPGAPVADLAWVLIYVNKSIPLDTASQQGQFLALLASAIGFDPSYMLVVNIDFSPVEYNIVTVQLSDDPVNGISAVSAMGMLATIDAGSLGVFTIVSLGGYGEDTGVNIGAIVAAVLVPIFVCGGAIYAYQANKNRSKNSSASGASPSYGKKAGDLPLSSPAASPSPQPVARGNLSPAAHQQPQPAGQPYGRPAPPPSRPLPPRLPPGWEQMTDDNGDTYFWHAATGTSQWDRPTA